MPSMRLARITLALALTLAARLAAAQYEPGGYDPPPPYEPPSDGRGQPQEAGEGPDASRTFVGAGSITFVDAGGTQAREAGFALGYRATQRGSGRFGTAVTLTWGLADWDRAGEWIDAGNDAGAWTTEKIKSVARWSQEGGEAQPIRLFAAMFAEPFLVMTYAAVPFCYAGSLGGATSHVQVDLTGTAYFGEGFVAPWLEAGFGAAAIPDHFIQWEYALGPVVGVGVDAGPVRIGGRVLWSPGGFNSTERADDALFTASIAVSRRY